MAGSSDEEVPKKRAPRKRAVSTNMEGEMRAPRRRVARKIAPIPREEVLVARESAPEPRETKRKAPTELRERSASKNMRRNQLVVALGILVVGVGVSAAVGFSDHGGIDVNQVVEERNERIRAGGGNADIGTAIIPVQNQNTAQKADGGLRPADPSTIPPPAPPTSSTTASSTATSTDATASSTETIIEESNGDESLNATTTESATL